MSEQITQFEGVNKPHEVTVVEFGASKPVEKVHTMPATEIALQFMPVPFEPQIGPPTDAAPSENVPSHHPGRIHKDTAGVSFLDALKAKGSHGSTGLRLVTGRSHAKRRHLLQ